MKLDTSIETVLKGYASGYFLMADEKDVLGWYGSEKRALIPLDERFHLSRSLKRKLRVGQFYFGINQQFENVVDGCAKRTETWITPELKAIYNQLHLAGFAHSFESYTAGGQLAGGILGITLGRAFIGESMFHQVTDGSKAAMAGLVEHLRACGFSLLDAQIQNPFLATFGCYEVTEKEFLSLFDMVINAHPTLPFTFLGDGLAAAVAAF